MQAGELREVLTFQKPVEGEDSFGQPDTHFETAYECVRGQVTALSSNEYIAAQQVVAGMSTRIKIRQMQDLNATWRIIHHIYDCDGDEIGFDVYDILGPPLADNGSGRRYYTLNCALRSAEGYRRGEE